MTELSPTAAPDSGRAPALRLAAALLVPRTRRLGGRLAALLFVAVFRADIQFTADSVRNPKAPWPLKAISVLRLPMQWSLITQAPAVSRRTPPTRGAGR